jgi:hypothetical protein
MYYIFPVLEDALAKFRACLREQLRCPQERSLDCMSALELLAVAAHRAGLRAEQLIILIKTEWEHAIQHSVWDDSVEHQRLRRTLVTSAIKAYYLQ